MRYVVLVLALLGAISTVTVSTSVSMADPGGGNNKCHRSGGAYCK